MKPFSKAALLLFSGLLATSLFSQTNGLPSGAPPKTNAADEWPVFRGDAMLSGVSGTVLPDDLQLLWAFKTAGGIESAVAIVGGMVYASALDSHLYAIDLQSGKSKWKYRAADETKSSPAVSNGVVYFGDDTGTFHAVDAITGKQKWQFQTDGEIISSANFSGDRILFGSYDNHLYCLTSDGKLAWKFATEGYVHGTPAIAGENVIIAGCDGFLRIIRIRDGAEVSTISLGAYAAASAAILHQHAFIGTFGNKFLCIDVQNRKINWEYDPPQRDFPFYASAAAAVNIVVVGGRDKMLHALAPQSGKALWTYATKAKIDSSPVIAGQRVFFGAATGEILGLDVNTGKVVWQFETGSSILASPSIARNKLIIGTTDGVLFCFGSKQSIYHK